MLIIDIILLIILLGFFIYGWQSGLIKTIGGVLGIVVGIIVAGKYYYLVADWLMPILEDKDNLARILGYLIVFVAVNVVMMVLVSVLTTVFKFVPFLTTLNRLAGAVLGLLGGTLAIGFLLIMIDKFPFAEFFTRYLEGSQIVPVIADVAGLLMPLLPEAFKEIKGILKV